MARMEDYTFMVTDLIKKEVLDVVELSSGYWDEIFNRPGAGLFTARLQAETTNKKNFRDWANGLYAIKDGEIKWGGIIGKTQRRAETQVLQVPTVGFYTYLMWRIIRNTQAMSFAQSEASGTDIAWRGVDQFNVVKDVVDHIQSFQDGDIGISVEWDALSGAPVTKVIPTFAFKYAGEFVDELASVLNGFTMEWTYEFNASGVPVPVMNLIPDSVPSVYSGTLLFQPSRKETVEVPIIAALSVPGANGDYAVSNTKTTISTNDLDVCALIQRDDWTMTGQETIASNWASSTQAGWKLDLRTDLKLVLAWTTDGIQGNSIVEISETGLSVTDGDEIAIRATLDSDNGAGDYEVNFYFSTDGGKVWENMKAPRTFGDTFGDEY